MAHHAQGEFTRLILDRRAARASGRIRERRRTAAATRLIYVIGSASPDNGYSLRMNWYASAPIAAPTIGATM